MLFANNMSTSLSKQRAAALAQRVDVWIIESRGRLSDREIGLLVDIRDWFIQFEDESREPPSLIDLVQVINLVLQMLNGINGQ